MIGSTPSQNLFKRIPEVTTQKKVAGARTGVRTLAQHLRVNRSVAHRVLAAKSSAASCENVDGVE